MILNKLLAGLTLAFLVSGASASTNLVANGNFETGSLSNWTLSGNTGFSSVTNTGANGYSWQDGAVGSLGEISQTISTVIGTAYSLSFDLMGTGTPNKVKVFFGEDLVPFSQTNFYLPNWTKYTITGLVADSDSSVLTFGSRNDPSYNFIDNITLTAPVPVPEPESYAMMLAGMGLMGAIVRRRKRSDLA